MGLELPKYKREYCCSECGLIWFAETTISNETTCPECGNSNGKGRGVIYACDSMGFVYAIDDIAINLEKEGKDIHYAKDHPLFNRKRREK